MMAFSGVRSSWLMLARKRARAVATASARSRPSSASRRPASAAVRRSAMSSGAAAATEAAVTAAAVTTPVPRAETCTASGALRRMAVRPPMPVRCRATVIRRSGAAAEEKLACADPLSNAASMAASSLARSAGMAASVRRTCRASMSSPSSGWPNTASVRPSPSSARASSGRSPIRDWKAVSSASTSSRSSSSRRRATRSAPPAAAAVTKSAISVSAPRAGSAGTFGARCKTPTKAENSTATTASPAPARHDPPMARQASTGVTQSTASGPESPPVTQTAKAAPSDQSARRANCSSALGRQTAPMMPGRAMKLSASKTWAGTTPVVASTPAAAAAMPTAQPACQTHSSGIGSRAASPARRKSA